MPLVLEQYPDAHLLLVGDGPERKEREKRVKEKALEENISFL